MECGETTSVIYGGADHTSCVPGEQRRYVQYLESTLHSLALPALLHAGLQKLKSTVEGDGILDNAISPVARRWPGPTTATP
jgi:hypothetical protein